MNNNLQYCFCGKEHYIVERITEEPHYEYRVIVIDTDTETAYVRITTQETEQEVEDICLDDEHSTAWIKI